MTPLVLAGLLASATATSTAASTLSDQRSRILLSAGVGWTSEVDGDRISLVPALDVHVRLGRRWWLDVSWRLPVLSSPDGTFVDPRREEAVADDVPRTGNPFVGGRFRAFSEPGLEVDLGLGVALPMASIEVPTPATGEPFERAPHSRDTYRRGIAVQGGRAPWLSLWDTATGLATLVVHGQEERVHLTGRLDAGLLIPAGRLRADPGAVVAFEGSFVYDLDPLTAGVRFDLTYLTPQRDELDRRIQIRGVQLAVSPEIELRFLEHYLVKAALIYAPRAGFEPEPSPEAPRWGWWLGFGLLL